jgi:hypothetical protein
MRLPTLVSSPMRRMTGGAPAFAGGEGDGELGCGEAVVGEGLAVFLEVGDAEAGDVFEELELVDDAADGVGVGGPVEGAVSDQSSPARARRMVWSPGPVMVRERMSAVSGPRTRRRASSEARSVRQPRSKLEDEEEERDVEEDEDERDFGAHGGRSSAATGPINEEAERRGEGGQAEEKAVAELGKLELVERELEALDGRAGMLSWVSRSTVQFTALRKKARLPSLAMRSLATRSPVPMTTRRPVRTLNGRLSRTCTRSEATMTPRRLAGSMVGHTLEVDAGIVFGEVAIAAVADLAPRGRVGGGEGGDLEAVAEGAAGIGADAAAEAEPERELVSRAGLGDGVRGKIAEDEIAVVGETLGVRVVDDDVVHQHAPVVEEVVEPVRDAGGEQDDEPAGAGAEILAEQLLLAGVVAALRGGGDDEGGIVGDFARGAELEKLDVEIAQLELVVEGGEAAVGIDVVGPELAVAGEEVDFFLLRAGNIEDGGGEDLFAEEGLFLAVLVAVELVERDDAALVAADEDDDVGLLDARLFRLAPVLIDVDVFGRDAAIGPASVA